MPQLILALIGLWFLVEVVWPIVSAVFTYVVLPILALVVGAVALVLAICAIYGVASGVWAGVRGYCAAFSKNLPKGSEE